MSDGEKTTVSQAPPVSEKQKTETVAEVIREKAPEILAAIPEQERAKLARITIEKHEISMRAGPLPDPSELAAYNQIIPGSADRILKMAENQSAHRIEIEKIVVSSQQRQSFCGQFFGLLIGLAGLGLATFAAISGQPWFGSIIGGATLVSLVSVFVYSKNDQKRDLSQKRLQVLPPQANMSQQGQKKKNRNNRR